VAKAKMIPTVSAEPARDEARLGDPLCESAVGSDDVCLPSEAADGPAVGVPSGDPGLMPEAGAIFAGDGELTTFGDRPPRSRLPTSSAELKHEVFIIDSAQVPHGGDSIERELLRDCAKVRLLLIDTEEDFLPYSHRADAIILWHHIRLTAGIMDKLTKTRLIVRNGVGYDNVDVAAASAAGIGVANVPDYGTEEVADHALALALALLRQIKPLMADVANGNWDWKAGAGCWRIRGRTVGVVGCGRIGTAFGLRAKALGFRVRFYDPYLPPGYEKAIGIERASSLQEVLSDSDLVSIHVPLTEETRHMIGSWEFGQMKKSAYLVNTARGPVVSSEALYEALSQDRIAGAGLDVLEDEPFGADMLQRLPNCIVTPHSGFYSQESLIEMRSKSAILVRDALVEGRYANLVNRNAMNVRETPFVFALRANGREVLA
jgi:phosphoglycerate dehydrogenase-like enzyme